MASAADGPPVSILALIAPAPSRRQFAAVCGALVAALLVVHCAPDSGPLVALRRLTAVATVHMLRALGLPIVHEDLVLTHAGGFACAIDAGCTALVPATLLSAALLTSPRSWGARLAGLLGAIVWLVLVNQLRLVSLMWIGVGAPGWFDVVHAWLWPPLMAAAAFGYAAAWWGASSPLLSPLARGGLGWADHGRRRDEVVNSRGQPQVAFAEHNPTQDGFRKHE